MYDTTPGPHCSKLCCQDIVISTSYTTIYSNVWEHHCTETYIPTTWESIGYADGNVLSPAN